MKKAVTILMMSVWPACSGDPSGDDGKPDDDAVDTGNPSDELPKIWVNEVMTSNATGVQDEVGAFPDWLELYNPNDAAVDLSGWWLTEDVDDPFKWQLPEDTSIEGGGYLLIFADDDTEEGPLHASFKLAGGGGDDVALFGPNLLDNPLVDSVEDMQPLPSDIALSRTPDGGPTWGVDNSPTPGAAND